MKPVRLVPFILLSVVAHATAQQVQYSFSELSTEDVLTIGRALDKLPREDTDRNQLYQRLQAQITAQDQARAKAAADVQKDTFDKAITDALNKTKLQGESPPGSSQAEP